MPLKGTQRPWMYILFQVPIILSINDNYLIVVKEVLKYGIILRWIFVLFFFEETGERGDLYSWHLIFSERGVDFYSIPR